MDYDILTASTAIGLAVKVNQSLDNGWVLCGGVAISNWDGGDMTISEYAQAMTSTAESRGAAREARAKT